MIAPHDDGFGSRPMSPLAASCFLVGAEAVRSSRMLDAAEYNGWQEDGEGGGFHLWTLRKPLGKHPAGSTIVQETLEKLLFPEGPAAAAKYGSAAIVANPVDFAAVEQPNKTEGAQ
jgi:hypothetical protein